MGLLSSGDNDADARMVESLFTGVVQDWEESVTPENGITCQVSQKGLSNATLLSDELFNGNLINREPGPFKRAAAAAILALYIPDLANFSRSGGKLLGGDEQFAWRARFAFSVIAPALGHMQITAADGKQMILRKDWSPPTAHYQIELIAWLRALEAPFSYQDNVHTLDVARVARAVLALGLIIEACYYPLDATLKNSSQCVQDALESHGMDVKYDCPGWPGFDD